MYEAKFELEAVTPIFMRGADQTKAEIRSSSIKGLMRWWFRALAGNYFGNDITGLKKAEEYIFGSTNQKSRIVIEVDAFKPEKFDFNKFRDLSYLWFSIKLSKPKIKYYYPKGTNIKVRICSIDAESFNIAVISFWALITLGSIGFRSRRGAGCLKFVGGDLNILKELSLKWKINHKNDLKNSILTAIEHIGSELNSILTAIGSELRLTRIKNLEPQPYPILSQRTSFVGLWDAKTGNPIEALKQFQNKYVKFRKDMISKKKRIVFGLPVNLKGKNVEEIREFLPNIRKGRRASPMIVGLISIGEKLYIRIVKFRTEPYHKEVNDISDWKVLKNFNEFINDLQVFGTLEVFE